MGSSSFFNANMLQSLSQKAIDCAIKGQWQEVADINSEILNESSGNTEVLNRLRKAYMEPGLIRKSINIFEMRMNISPNNPIALKHLKKLQSLAPSNQRTSNHVPSAPHDFIEDSKTVTTNLINLTSP